MTGKFHIWIILVALAVHICYGGEFVPAPGTLIRIPSPPGWSGIRTAGDQVLLKGPGRDPVRIPRICVTTAAVDPEAAATSLRSGFLWVADGCEILDDDQVRIGPRQWRHIRMRFATGPVAFGQSVWIGTVGGRTLVVVLSSPDDDLASLLPTATGLVAALDAG